MNVGTQNKFRKTFKNENWPGTLTKVVAAILIGILLVMGLWYLVLWTFDISF